MAKRKHLDEIMGFLEYGLDVPSRTIYIGSGVEFEDESEVNSKLAEKVIKAIHLLDFQANEESKPITLIVEGSGGDYYSALAIFNAIRSCKSHTISICYGAVMSAHSIIFQSAKERIMAKRSRQMIHVGEFGVTGHPKVVKNWAKESERIDKDVEDIYLERILEKNPEFDRKDLKKLLVFDSILSSEKCLELGLVDKIL